MKIALFALTSILSPNGRGGKWKLDFHTNRFSFATIVSRFSFVSVKGKAAGPTRFHSLW